MREVELPTETGFISDSKLEYIPLSTPHRCPICGGNGLVDNGFYNQTSGSWSSTGTIPETCRTCNGEGIVWSKL